MPSDLAQVVHRQTGISHPRQARALIAYADLHATLATQLGVDPALAARAVHLEVLREQPTLF